MKIGDRIRLRREELRLSQEDLAFRLGYKSRSSINKIERDASGLPQSKIVTIATALDTTPEWIMGWDNREPDRHSKTLSNPDLIQMIEDFTSLDQHDQIVIRTMINTLLNTERMKTS